MKKAWFITHDQYIDRRIFFFTDVLESHGYDVKLFGDSYYDVLCRFDPEFIIRPEMVSKVRRYYVENSQVDDYIVETVKKVIKSRKKIKGTIKIKEKLDSRIDEVTITTSDESIDVVVNCGSATFFYNTKDNYYIIHNKADSAAELTICENALIKYLNNNLEDDEKTAQIIDSVKIAHITDNTGNKKVYMHVEQSAHLYVYDVDEESIVEYSPLSLDDFVTDSMGGKQYNYKEFRDNIYEYSKILYRVNKELEFETPDVVYVADLPTLPIGIMIKELCGCKLIMDCHEWWYKNCELWSYQNPLSISLSDKYEKQFYPSCDLLITVGKHLASRMEEHIGCKFEVIYSCMSTSLEEGVKLNSDVNLREIYSLKDTDKIVIFQGGMSTNRNLENLARATKYYSEDTFLLLLTTGDYQNKFKEILQNEGNPERVVWGGWINQADLLKYTKGADLGIIPYTAVNDYAECFVPNKMTEYFVSQIPVLYDNSLRELDYVLGGNSVGVGIDLTDPEKMGSMINELLHDEKRLSLCKGNYEKCKNLLSYSEQKKMFDEYLCDYKILAE